MSEASPPSWWFDPPEPRHSDKSIIPDECNCEECHAWHVEDGQVFDNAKSPDFQCCSDQVETWIEAGEICKDHKNFDCEECENDCENNSLGM